MKTRVEKISLIKLNKPQTNDINELLQWFGSSLGLFSMRDKENSCFRVFISLLHAVRDERVLSSDEIAFQTNLSRGTVVFHLHKLEDSGIVCNDNDRYRLEVDTIEGLVRRIQATLDERSQQLKDVAKMIDQQLDLHGDNTSLIPTNTVNAKYSKEKEE